MKRVHCIRLKGPWEFQWTEGFSPESPDDRESGRRNLPASWEDCFGGRSGRVSWTRRFQRPTNLDSNERVLLSLEGNCGIERVTLNGNLVPHAKIDGLSDRYDLTPGLLPTNLITVDIVRGESDSTAVTGLASPVQLEIWRVE